MKVIVKENFIDKYTKKNYQKNDILDITKKRYNEILKVGNLIEKEKTVEKDSEKIEISLKEGADNEQ